MFAGCRRSSCRDLHIRVSVPRDLSCSNFVITVRAFIALSNGFANNKQKACFRARCLHGSFVPELRGLNVARELLHMKTWMAH
eukprot:1681065-Pleurochrysis_carterae.AAC.1